MNQERLNTIFLDCNGCGIKDLLRRKIFEDGYSVQSFLKKERIAILESQGQDPLVMKISKDTNQMAEEIRCLLDIYDNIKGESLRGIPDMRKWGILVLNDSDPQRQSQVLAYYTMPENYMTLDDYIESQRSWQKIDAIIDVGCQLINIIKDIHLTGHSYNNMKAENIMVNDGEVTLVGFGNVRKISRPPKEGYKKYSVWKRGTESKVT